MITPRFLAVLAAGAVCCSTALAAQAVVDGTLPGGGDCASFGNWNPASLTCRVEDHVIAAGDSVRVESAILEIVGTLRNEGLLDNRATIVVEGFLDSVNDVVNFWDGTLINRGEFFSHFMYNFGPLVNEATGTIEFEFHLENNASMTNLGHIDISGHYLNIPAKIFENRGSLEVQPTGMFSNEGVFINTGQFGNSGVVVNYETFVEHCDGLVTGNPIGGGPSTYAQALTVGRTLLEWCAVPGASGYDIAQGDVALLRSTGGDFAVSTGPCLDNDVVGLSLAEGSEPAPGEGFWFTARPDGVADPTYDSVSSSQSGSRDAGIGVSVAPCP